MLLKILQLSSIIQGTIKHDPLRNQAVILIWRWELQNNLKHLIRIYCWINLIRRLVPWYSYKCLFMTGDWEIIFEWIKIMTILLNIVQRQQHELSSLNFSSMKPNSMARSSATDPPSWGVPAFSSLLCTSYREVLRSTYFGSFCNKSMDLLSIMRFMVSVTTITVELVLAHNQYSLHWGMITLVQLPLKQ